MRRAVRILDLFLVASSAGLLALFFAWNLVDFPEEELRSQARLSHQACATARSTRLVCLGCGGRPAFATTTECSRRGIVVQGKTRTRVDPRWVGDAGSTKSWAARSGENRATGGKCGLTVSPRVTDRGGRPLLTLASADGEWRRPVPLDRVSPWLVSATLAVEDSRFRSHAGVDPFATARAALQNLASGRVVSGASTLTMQVCRMLDPRPRTLFAKALEAVRALRLERRMKKDGILEIYLGLAPYGGNIRGVDSASRIWFGKDPLDLSLAEAALLAGLPQSPSRHRPDRHPESARRRRDRVLERMLEVGVIGRGAYEEARRTPVRVRPLREVGSRLSPPVGRHAAFLALARRPAGGATTIDLGLQEVVEAAAREHAAGLPPGSDVAVVVIDVESGGIRALVGSADPADPVDGLVNGALARRSPGSALKPFLFAAGFATGRLGPETLIPDRPVDLGGWRPRNFAPGFSGEVTAAEALRRSLNIPALLVTRATGLARCAGVLEASGARLPAGAASRGGLALATGAVEVTLLDLTNAYATLARGGVRRPARLFPDEPVRGSRTLPPRIAAAIDEILSCRERAPAGYEEVRAEDLAWFMWKTGTSSGRRDAWAVGHNRRFAAGVWAGRFSGAGHFAYTGAAAAEPLLARLFQHPELRAAGAPPPAERLDVRRPFFAIENATAPRILSPSAGEVFVAVNEAAAVHLRAANAGRATWFLDGRLLPAGGARRLALGPGRYEVRLVTDGGEAASSVFTVR